MRQLTGSFYGRSVYRKSGGFADSLPAALCRANRTIFGKSLPGCRGDRRRVNSPLVDRLDRRPPRPRDDEEGMFADPLSGQSSRAGWSWRPAESARHWSLLFVPPPGRTLRRSGTIPAPPVTCRGSWSIFDDCRNGRGTNQWAFDDPFPNRSGTPVKHALVGASQSYGRPAVQR